MELAPTKHKLKASNFRGYLQEELLERCRKNPNYSLRSFARSLQVEPSALSQMINGKRPITAKMKLRLGTALGLSQHQLKRLATSEGENTKESQSGFQQLTLDAFAVIADWYHYAILELTYVDGFKSDPTWLAQRLGITKSEVNIAIERLERLQLLKRNSKNELIDTSENGELTHIHSSLSSEAARKYQIQLLELSKRAVQETPISQRNHSSATFCFDPNDLPDAIDRLTEFRREFAKEFQPKKKGKEVYQIQISFFPLTHSNKLQEKK